MNRPCARVLCGSVATVLMLIFLGGAFLFLTNNSVISWNPSVDECSANSVPQVNRVPAAFSCGVVAVCKVLSATFIVAQGGDCISLRYDIAVQSPTNSSELTAGFNASSCDAFDGNCCNGLLIPASSVTSNNVTLPCWILNKNNGFVNIVAQPHCPTASKTVTDEATDEATTTTSVSRSAVSPKAEVSLNRLLLKLPLMRPLPRLRCHPLQLIVSRSLAPKAEA